MATKKPKPDPNAPPDPNEINLLRSLERSERTVRRLMEAKADDVAAHNEGIKDAQESRNAILKSLEDWRNGVQSLPLE